MPIFGTEKPKAYSVFSVCSCTKLTNAYFGNASQHENDKDIEKRNHYWAALLH